MKPIIVFVYKMWVLGGFELLCWRMGRAFLRKGYQVAVMYNSLSMEVNDMFHESGFQLWHISDWWSIQNYKKWLLADEVEKYIITSDINEYLRCAMIYSQKLKTIQYITLETELFVLEGDIFHKWNYDLTKKYVKVDAANGHMAVLDYAAIEATEKYYHLDNMDQQMPIVRVGVDLVPANDEIYQEHCKSHNGIKLLSIARADFPLKAYLMGLLRFASIWNERHSLDITIITYGTKEDEIKNLCDTLSYPQNVSVQIVAKKQYYELEEYYRWCNLYVGMGTTVLDAAQRGILSIPISPNTFEVQAENFFHNNSYEMINVAPPERNRFYSLVKEVAEMSANEYLEAAKKSRKIMEEQFDVNQTTDSILRILRNVEYNRREKTISQLYWFRKGIHHIKKLLMKIKNE